MPQLTNLEFLIKVSVYIVLMESNIHTNIWQAPDWKASYVAQCNLNLFKKCIKKKMVVQNKEICISGI